jgi:hypothetical protein
MSLVDHYINLSERFQASGLQSSFHVVSPFCQSEA